MFKLCVFAGTTEGRELVELLAGQPAEVTACVATEYGETLLEAREGLRILSGRLSMADMAALLGREKYDLVIDATHPYAAEVTENIEGACAETGTEYVRLLRDSDSAPDGAVCAADIEGAIAYLENTEGNILLTTGSKELGKYTALTDFKQRVYARVLPMEASLEACRAAGLAPDRIIAMQGPFSRELNTAMLKAVSAKFMVTKDTGNAGGFAQKAAAAKEAGAVLVVVGRPPQKRGLDFSGTVKLLEERLGQRFRPTVTLAGIGTGGADGMTGEVRRAIRDADCVIGARRMLGAAAGNGQVVCEAVAPEAITKCIQENTACRKFAVVLSGDCGFFSGAKRLIPLLTGCDVRILPGISSLQALCARLGTSYEDVVTVSLHGRDRDIVPDVWFNRRVFALVGGSDGMAQLCRTLTEAGLDHVQVSVGERLGYPEERIVIGRAGELAGSNFDPLSVALIENGHARPFCPGLPDECFLRGQAASGAAVPMTKREVRACVLSMLALTSGAVCWDVGAGTGSVSVEMALMARDGTVFAIEKKDAALALLEDNRAKFHVSNLRIVPGEAPGACAGLPAPTHVFIGGSSGNLREIVELALEKNPAVRIAVSAVTLESVGEMNDIVRDFDGAEVVCLNASRGRKAGNYHLMTAQNPVYVFCLRGEARV